MNDENKSNNKRKKCILRDGYGNHETAYLLLTAEQIRLIQYLQEYDYRTDYLELEILDDVDQDWEMV